MKNRIIPVLLLHEDGLIKTQKFDKPKYIGDPINAIKVFNQKEVDEMVFLDIGASKQGSSPNFELINDIASECFMPLAYGGGIKSLECAEKLIKIGVEKIILNHAVIENISLIQEISKIIGNQSVVVSIDIKKSLLGGYRIYSHVNKKMLSLNLDEYILEVQNQGAGEIFINSVNEDGMMNGYDLSLLDKILNSVDIPMIFCGGAGSFDDIEEASSRNEFIGLAAGSLFVFKGPHRAVLINYPIRNL